MPSDSPVAGRLKRPSWTDPRLLIGIALIALSLVAVAMTVRAADSTVAHYSARDTLTPGSTLTEQDVVVSAVKVPDGEYLETSAEPRWGAVVTRTVGAGELVPVDALTDADDAGVRPIAVTTSLPLAEGLQAGSVVDVWLTTEDDAGARSTVLIGEGLTVTAVERADGAFASGGDTVHVGVDTAGVAAFLDAVASGGALAVVGPGSN
ncbi:hypothetical protein [Demequina globuliformis]|uniref:hypothetical protein n=1 Tax=Demequina globuliformis TaxID=676202 RepID=UPI000783D160|nr:hypothetical protein [Demequina globuliformis]